MIHLYKRKKITRCFKVRWNWFTQFHRLDSHFNWFFFLLSSCSLYFLVFSWLSYLLPKTAMEILWKYKWQKGEDFAGWVYFYWFCTSVFPNGNLMSSQRPISIGWEKKQLSCSSTQPSQKDPQEQATPKKEAVWVAKAPHRVPLGHAPLRGSGGIPPQQPLEIWTLKGAIRCSLGGS